MIHLLAPPHTQTTRAYALDGFTQATIRFARVLKLIGLDVTLYASEENEAPCNELVTCIAKGMQQTVLGDCPYQYGTDEKYYDLWDIANREMAHEIGLRKKPGDIICTIGGTAQKHVTDAHPDLFAVEYSVGYVASYSPFRVFESHAWRHWTYGAQGNLDGRFYDDVIPLFFDPGEFTVRTDKEPFLLYVGRLTSKKGLEIACKAAEVAEMPLKIIGHGDESLVTNGAEYLGALGNEERNQWMSRASALICPTMYIEPFGSVAVEAQLCGTPVIATAFGAFSETVDHGNTGYLCNFLGEFVEAIRSVKNLDPERIRRRAESLYSIEAAAASYARYFKRLATLRTSLGWYSTL